MSVNETKSCFSGAAGSSSASASAGAGGGASSGTPANCMTDTRNLYQRYPFVNYNPDQKCQRQLPIWGAYVGDTQDEARGIYGMQLEQFMDLIDQKSMMRIY